jgi:hypothetical protein
VGKLFQVFLQTTVCLYLCSGSLFLLLNYLCYKFGKSLISIWNPISNIRLNIILNLYTLRRPCQNCYEGPVNLIWKLLKNGTKALSKAIRKPCEKSIRKPCFLWFMHFTLLRKPCFLLGFRNQSLRIVTFPALNHSYLSSTVMKSPFFRWKLCQFFLMYRQPFSHCKTSHADRSVAMGAKRRNAPLPVFGVYGHNVVSGPELLW